MSLWKIAWRSIQQRALASSLTGISMALGVMLVVAVLVIHGVVNQSFLNNSGLGYNMVVGAKGGRLDLVLNTVYYLARRSRTFRTPTTRNSPRASSRRYVDKAIPLCLGDMYQDFRVVGTTPAFFNDLDYGGKKYEFAAGRNFEPDEYFGAVIGATVARETGLTVGSEFQPSHGAGPDAHQHDPFTVLGVLKPTGTPNDRGAVHQHGRLLSDPRARQAGGRRTRRPPSRPMSTSTTRNTHDDEHANETRTHADHEPARTCGTANTAKDDHEEHRGHEDEHEHEHGAADGHEHAAHEHERSTSTRITTMMTTIMPAIRTPTIRCRSSSAR